MAGPYDLYRQFLYSRLVRTFHRIWDLVQSRRLSWWLIGFSFVFTEAGTELDRHIRASSWRQQGSAGVSLNIMDQSQTSR